MGNIPKSIIGELTLSDVDKKDKKKMKPIKFCIEQPLPVEGEAFKFNGKFVDCRDVEDTGIGFHDNDEWIWTSLSVFGLLVVFCECLCFAICCGVFCKYLMKSRQQK